MAIGTAEPDLVRISILGGDTQLDLALPGDLPITALIGDVLGLLRLPEPAHDPERAGELPRWTLARIGAPPLPAEQSLSGAGVVDGELLMVHPDLPDAPGALIDDVVDGLAHLAGRQRPGWSSEAARLLGYGIAVAATLAAVIAGRTVVAAGPLVPIASGVACAALLAGVLLGHRLAVDPRSLATASCCAFLTGGLAGSFVPHGDSPGATAATAAGCALVVAVIVHRCTGVAPRLHAGLGTGATLIVLGGLLAMVLPGGPPAAAAVTAALGVLTVLLSARVAIAAGRLPLPPVPSVPPPPPDALDTDVVLDGVGALGTPAEHDPLTAIADLALVDMRSLQRRAAVASAYLTGIVAGAVVVTVAAVAGVAATCGGAIAALLFCAAVSVALLARGRVHADRAQSAILLGGGSAGLLAMLLGTGSPAIVFVGGLALGLAAFVIGVTADAHDYSPLQRRTLELAEYAVIAAILPLLCWLLDAYRAIREF
ncbi:type VII secretion integral membrane protein EccD [Gordonia sp. PP30]|uniref:type VII secretion integral membrane protein EccD n=1 Tax=unclassified Gordonia (in: high G+C Gram-positive bacteria) TaxID=2657482 RepID=UPI001FFFD78B|nr:type VII secretion integral membrane protein EccD [Gordonia sp. PP30]UQE76093.1 type VII secretion integral membrane protein EccD [Gordonia sp. PP30]